MPRLSTLDALGQKYGTDKASPHHDYLAFYEMFFAPLQTAKLTVLEVGVATGASLRTWEEYFPYAKIIGADIVPSKHIEQNRITIELLDQSNVEQLTQVAVKHGPFDIIIEDGSHMWEHQITTLRTLFPFVKPDGFYVVEDLQTNYGPLQERFRGVASTSCVEYLKTWADLRVGDDQIDIAKIEDAFLRTYGRAIHFITFYRRACLIKKKYRPATVASVTPKENAGPPLFVSGTSGVRLAVKVLAHVGYEGEVVSEAGLINPGADQKAIQGISIDTDDGLIEYRVRRHDGTWSPWARGGNFVGTRGQSKSLTGISVRLVERFNNRYTLRVVARFAGVRDVVEAKDGQDCVAKAGESLCALQLELVDTKPAPTLRL